MESDAAEAGLGAGQGSIIDPAQPIIDCHHHLWGEGVSTAPGGHHPYLLPELRRDLESGHDVRATVYIEAGSGYFRDGPEAMRPVGETRFARMIGEEGDAQGLRVCAAIIAHADLTNETTLPAVLDAHVAEGGGRVRGVRQMVTPRTMAAEFMDSRRLLFDPAFRAGLATVAEHGLHFEAMLFHHQHPGLIEAARALPQLRIVVNHLGAPMHIGPYAGRRSDVIAAWKDSMARLADLPNVSMKLGGVGLFTLGHGWSAREQRIGAAEIVAETGDYIHYAIDQFGPDRCMFESNFPPDGQAASYRTLWNAFKIMAAPYTREERMAMFHDNAARTYRIFSPTG